MIFGQRSSLVGAHGSEEFQSNLNQSSSKYIRSQRRYNYPMCSELCDLCNHKISETHYDELFTLVMDRLIQCNRHKCQITNKIISDYVFLHKPSNTRMSYSFYSTLSTKDQGDCECYWLFNSNEGRMRIAKNLRSMRHDSCSYESISQYLMQLHPKDLGVALLKGE